MASSSGLTRRRGAGTDDNGTEGSAPGTPTPRGGPSTERSPETSYTGGENGHKIAFDPRDISESAERSKQPKLTLMEEVLLMGLKDKQVGEHGALKRTCLLMASPGVPIVLERQHILRATRLHRDRTGISGSCQHAEGLGETAIPPVRPGY